MVHNQIIRIFVEKAKSAICNNKSVTTATTTVQNFIRNLQRKKIA